MTKPSLPLVLAGPLLRSLSPNRLTLWLALSQPARLQLELAPDGEPAPTLRVEPGSPACRLLSAGRRLHYLLIDLQLETPLPTGRWVGYRSALQPLDRPEAPWQPWEAWAPDLTYPGRGSPGFVLPERAGALLHGSCRKPHYPGGDGLVEADGLLARREAESRRD